MERISTRWIWVLALAAAFAAHAHRSSSEEAVLRAKKVGKMLSSILRARRVLKTRPGRLATRLRQDLHHL